MKLSILLPTLGSRIDELERLFISLENQENDSFELIVISQGNHEVIEELINKFSFEYKHIKINKTGLSYARNIGMRYVEGNYLALSDDDAWYPKYAVNKIINEMKKSKNEILCFKIFDPISNKYYKNYLKHKENVNIIQMLKKSSIEICFDLTKIDKKKIVFNEKFGLGTEFQSGEENLLMNELRKNGYKIKFINETVVYHRIKEASEIDESFIKTKANILKLILGKFGAYIYLNLILIKNINKINSIGKVNAFINAMKVTILN